MNNTAVRITVGSEFSGLPELSDHQRLLLKQITEGDAVLRGAPGSNPHWVGLFNRVTVAKYA